MEKFKDENSNKFFIRKFKIVFWLILIMLMSFAFLILVSSKNINQTLSSISTKSLANAGETSNVETQIGNLAYITSAQIIQTKTGTGPWDDNDEAGNDSSEDNNIVRSFDQVTWTVDVTMALKETTESGLTGGTIRVNASLPEYCANVVTWDLDSMKWIEDGTVSNDGRTLTGKYSMSETEITVPGKQTLVFVLKILGVSNKTEITPTFNFSIDGNNENEIVELQGETIFASAKGKYNIQLVRNGNLATKASVDYGKGDTLGRMYGYSFVLQLYNEDESKGLKGIEYPKGKITFDIDLALQRSQIGSTELEDITNECTPILWNYRVNNWKKSTIGGIKDREMFLADAYSLYEPRLPLGMYVNDKYSTYNSGDINIVQEARTLKVSVSDYDFNGIFPYYESLYNGVLDSGRDKIYTNNIGTFSIGYMQIFVPNNDASTIGDRNYFLTVSNDNMSINTVSGENITSQMQRLDDSINVQHVIYRKGSYYQQIIPYDRNTGKLLESYYSVGDGKATVGQQIEISTKFVTSANNEENIYTANRFIKFDGNGYEPDYYSNGDKYKWSASAEGSPKFRIWYVTKKDGTNWINQTEMNNANIEDMDIYDNIEDIPKEKICVGVYAEMISGYIYRSISTGGKHLIIPLKIKENAIIGRTYGMTQRTQLWVEQLDRNEYSVLHPENKYPKAEWDSGNRQYIKAEYDENGEIIVGTHSGGFQWGETIFVIGANLHGSINATGETGAYKVNYDLGKNENTVTYNIEPQIDENNNITTQISDITLKAEITLPEGIKYKVGTSKRGEETYTEPEVTTNSDGTTILVWYIYGCTSGQTITPITFEAQIDNESENGEQYTTTLIVSEVIGEDEISKIGNSEIKNRTSSETINVINLASHTLYKEVETPVIEKNGEITFKITYENKTEETISEYQLLDILPYNGDTRGTSYTGTYTLNKVTIKESIDGVEQNNSNLKIYVTSSETVKELDSKNTEIGTSSIWNEKTSGQTIGEKATGIAIKGEISGKEKIEIEVVLTTVQNTAEDVYANNAMAQIYSNSEQMQTGNVKATVINRIIEGKVWLDSNKNGLINEGEQYLSNIKLTLTNEDGNEIKTVTTDENGYYQFKDVQKGNYKVQVEITDPNYEITTKEVGVNKEINNKFNDNGITDVISTLNSIQSPELKEENVNAGITYKDASVIVHHYIEGTTTKLSEDVTVNGKITDTYKTQAATDIPEYYELVEMPTNATGTMTLTQIEVIYYYKLKKYNYTVNYLEKDSNKILQTAKTVGNITHGTQIQASNEIIEIEGYKYDSIDKEILTIGTNNNEINIYYIRKEGQVIVKYIDKTTGEEISAQTAKKGFVGETYDVSEYEKDIEGYTLVEEPNPKTGTYTEEEQTKIYYYLQNAQATVQHIDRETGEILKEETEKGKVGDKFTTHSENFDGYILVKSPKELTITMTKEEQTLKYYYAKISAGVLEKHIDEITGELLASNAYTGNEGDMYSIQAKEFQGYDLVTDKLPTNATGKMTVDLIEVKYYYIKKATVRVQYIDKGTGEKIAEDVIIQGHEEDQYTTEQKEFENYKLIEKTNNTTGTMKTIKNEDGTYNTETLVQYYYGKNSAGVLEKHMDIKSEEILKQDTHKGYVGIEYNIPSREFEGYDLVTDKLPTNATGKMTEEEIEVDYYYIKKAKVIVKHIDELTGEELDTEEIEGHEGDKYKTEVKEFEGYDLVEEKIPENAMGEMKVETTVIYYYKKKSEVEVKYLEKDTNKELLGVENIQGYVEEEYKTEEKEIPYYNMVEKTNNTTGKMTEEKITVIYYYEKQAFNLKIDKWISNITINGISQRGKTIDNKEELLKIEINRKKITETDIKITYKIRISNTGEIEGTANQIIEKIPSGYSFYQEDNQIKWTKASGVLMTEVLGGENIKPGEYKEIEIVLRWDKGEESTGEKENIVIISNVSNPAGYAEIDESDNSSKASMLITVATGLDKNHKVAIIVAIVLLITSSVIILKLKNKKK